MIMPVYDYKCNSCEKTFTIALSISNHDKSDVKCPDCGSASVAQLFTGFFAKTESKS